MGEQQRSDLPGLQRHIDSPRANSYSGSRSPDGRFVGGVARGPYTVGIPVGTQFGDLTVLERVNRNKAWDYRVQCTCGSTSVVTKRNLVAGRTTRCNACAKRAAGEKRWLKYSEVLPDTEHRSRLLNRISSCIQRCHNPKNSSYKDYGERGIQVHSAWREDRGAFLRYLIDLEGWDNPDLDLDRTDNNRGYEPGNLRFVSRSDNARNKRKICDLEARIKQLEAENARLRSLELRAEI